MINARAMQCRGRIRTMSFAVTLALSGLALTGCQTDAQTGAVAGGALGAIGGAVIGHNDGGRSAEGAAIGGALGAGLGYIIGNESDKQRHHRNDHQRGNYDY